MEFVTVAIALGGDKCQCMEQCHGKGTVTTRVDAAIVDNNTVQAAIAAAKQDLPTIIVARNHDAGAVASEPLTQMTETECAKLQAQKFGVNKETKNITQRGRFGLVDDRELTKRATFLEEGMGQFKTRA